MRVLQPFCRARLTAADFAFIRTVLLPEMTEQAAFNRLFSDEQMLDVLLDDPRLYRELLESVEHVEVSLPLYFYVTTRNVLTTSGIDDREVADYLASLLVTSAENRLAPGGARGQRQGFYAVDMMARIQAAPPAQAFALTLSLANQALFYAGVFPEHIRRRTRRRAAPGLEYYDSVGSAHFRAASGHTLAREFALESVLGTLGEGFREARRALNDFSDRVAFVGHASDTYGQN